MMTRRAPAAGRSPATPDRLPDALRRLASKALRREPAPLRDVGRRPPPMRGRKIGRSSRSFICNPPIRVALPSVSDDVTLRHVPVTLYFHLSYSILAPRVTPPLYLALRYHSGFQKSH